MLLAGTFAMSTMLNHVIAAEMQELNAHVFYQALCRRSTSYSNLRIDD